MSAEAGQPDVHGAVAELLDHSWTNGIEPGVVKVRASDWLALRDAHEWQLGLRRCPTCDQYVPAVPA